MTKLKIDRLSASATGWPEPGQVPRMLKHVAADRLESALREHPLPDGDWCIRRLDVAVELDPDRPLSALETDWADRIVTALRLSLRDGSQDVVRFVRPEAAVDDLLLGVAMGRFERTWAWRQLDLLEPGDPEPNADPAAVVLRVLGRLQHGRVAALARLVSRAGVPVVHRLLGSSGWARAAALVALEAGTTWSPEEDVGTAVNSGPDPAGDRTRATLAAAILSTGGLATALRTSGLRVDPVTLQAWAVLAVAATDPSLLHSGTRRLAPLVAAIMNGLQPTAAPGLGARPVHRSSPSAPAASRLRGTTPASGHRPGKDTPAAHPSTATATTGTQHQVPGAEPDHRPDAAVTTPTSQPETVDSAVDASPEGLASSWGGLLYLLNSAADAGLPDLLDEPPFLARPAPWVMHRVGMALVPVEPDDPALLAFAGMPAWGPQQPPDHDEQRAIDACVRRWSAVTARRLRPDDADESTDAELVQRIARREAAIAQEPGWVEVRLRLDQVDLAVRRAGLDVDPGWVWWLGHVVRFRYE